ncbi:MAG: PepSY domain-containing protein [Thaumarchaeota archaeon]|nr:PepSY domain-containing protein [Nitrososphaerota archaeon]
MTNQVIKNKKLVIAAAVTVGVIAAALLAFSPLLASAQTAPENKSPPQITGSVDVGKTMKNLIKEGRNISFSDAVSTAEKKITNGVAVGGHLGIVQGFLVYTIVVQDQQADKTYAVIVDAGNGQVLYTSEGHQMKSFGGMFGDGGMSCHGHGFGQRGMHQGQSMPEQPQSQNQPGQS